MCTVPTFLPLNSYSLGAQEIVRIYRPSSMSTAPALAKNVAGYYSVRLQCFIHMPEVLEISWKHSEPLAVNPTTNTAQSPRFLDDFPSFHLPSYRGHMLLRPTNTFPHLPCGL